MEQDESSNSIAPDSPNNEERPKNSLSENKATVSGTNKPLDLSATKWQPIVAEAQIREVIHDANDRDLLPASCGARQLSKLKRYLTTIQQVAFDISAETAEKVRQGIFALVNGTITAEQFQSQLHATIKFPSRPFVTAFIEASLPYLQRELIIISRFTQEHPHVMLSGHHHLTTNANSNNNSALPGHNSWPTQRMPEGAPQKPTAVPYSQHGYGGPTNAPKHPNNSGVVAADKLLFLQALDQVQETAKRMRLAMDGASQWSSKEREAVGRFAETWNASPNSSHSVADLHRKMETKRGTVTKKSESSKEELSRLLAQLNRVSAVAGQLSIALLESDCVQLQCLLDEVEYRLTLQSTDRQHSSSRQRFTAV